MRKAIQKIYHEDVLEDGLSFKMKELARKIEIMKDQQTGVQYCVVEGSVGRQMAVFPLIDADGKPIIGTPE